jgi:arylsulfatase
MINNSISRREFLRTLATTATGLAVSSQVSAKNTESVRPNVILIIGDDISVDDFGCYGHPSIRTPNIDELAAEGLRFTNAYLTTSQCSPTRCSVITGRYPHNTGAPELHTPLPEGQVMFPAILRQAGYYTAAAGKWHMGNYAKSAFDKIVDSGPGGEERWVQCLQQRPKDKPFFMWFASHDAHRGWSKDKGAEPHSLEDAVIPPYLIDTPAVRKDIAQYYDEVQRLDRYTGEMVKELRKQGIFDNTCIFFMADNGRPFPRCKTRLYDSGIKTPFVVHWPGGLENGSAVCHSLVSVIDIAPTILELVGLKPTQSFQGVSMMPLLADPASSIRNYVFAEHNWHGQIAHERMVRHGSYIYIRNAHPQLPQICGLDAQCPQKELRALADQGKLISAQMDPLLEPRPAEELFALNDDPHQINNLVRDPKHSKVLGILRELMDEWQRRTGDTTPPLDKATPDRYDRRTGKPVHGKSGRPKGGVVPGQTTRASQINDPGPR